MGAGQCLGQRSSEHEGDFEHTSTFNAEQILDAWQGGSLSALFGLSLGWPGIGGVYIHIFCIRGILRWLLVGTRTIATEGSRHGIVA